MQGRPISEFTSDELVRPSEIPTSGKALEIDVPFSLTERRVYTYIEVKQSPSAATYIIAFEILATFDGHIVGKFPLIIGDIASLTTNKSLPSLFNAGGSPVGDSLVIRLNNPFDTSSTGIQAAVLQPLRFNGECNKLTLRLLAANGANVIGWRAYFACLSTRF
jgi:hypothetical protein